MVKRVSVPLFFFLAYLFTWSNWLPRALAARGISSYEPPEFIVFLAGYGPALLPYLPPAADLRMYFFIVAVNWLVALAILFATRGSLHGCREEEKQNIIH
jgi:hypothetical protein